MMEIDAFIESIETTGRATNEEIYSHEGRHRTDNTGIALHCTQEKSTRLIWQRRVGERDNSTAASRVYN